jgi:tetratricopeptide (TPR) repeat protein
VALTIGCDDLLVVDPTESVPPDVATGTANAVQALLLGVYDRLRGGTAYWTDMFIEPEILADNARTSSPPGAKQGEAVNQIGAHMGGWEARYQAINEANYVIASAQTITDGSDELRNRFQGEALFLRALNTFDLARIYSYEPGRVVGGWNAGVVLRTVPTRTVQEAASKARATITETYEQIESDLLQSIQLLTTAGGTNVYYATRGAAEALLGRVYLYWGDWANAVNYSTAALQHTTARLSTASEYPTIFTRQPNPESLFEVVFHSSDFNQNYVNFCLSCYLRPNGLFYVWPSQELLATYDAADVRLSLYGTTANGTRYVNKFQESVDAYMDNIPLIRYSEVLLNRAEAYAESGQAAPALADLNQLRAARNLGPVTGLAGPALVSAILEERRRELAFEGHRWFDLKRKGMAIPKPAFTGLGMLPYADFRVLAPLPETEVQNDELLTQNPGY